MIDMNTADLNTAFEGSYYTIVGTGGDLAEWQSGYNAMLKAEGIGTPKEWFITNGRAINEYAGTKGTVTNPFQDDVTVLMFPLEGLHAGVLSILRLRAGDRWFDDIVDNMIVTDSDDDEDDDDGYVI